MSNKKLLLFFVFLALAIFIFLFWKKTSSPYLNEIPATKFYLKPSENLEGTPKSLTQTSSWQGSEPASSKLSSPLSVEILKCFPDSQNIQALENLYSYIKGTESVQEEIPEEELWHFADNTGQQFRAQLLYFNDKKEFRLFKVHRDGLPDPINLSKEESFNPSLTTLSKYIPFETLPWYRKKSSIKTAKGASLFLELTNSKVTGLEYFFEGKSIQCTNSECHCSVSRKY